MFKTNDGDSMRMVDRLIEQALALPIADREAIVEQLLESISPNDEDWFPHGSFEQLIEARLAEVDAGEIYEGTMDDLLADIRRKVAENRK